MVMFRVRRRRKAQPNVAFNPALGVGREAAGDAQAQHLRTCLQPGVELVCERPRGVLRQQRLCQRARLRNTGRLPGGYMKAR